MKLFKTVIVTFITNILVLCIGLLISVITARWLGPTAKGILGVSGSVVALFLIISDLGIGVANTYFVAKYKDKIDRILGCNVIVIILEIFLITIIYVVSRQCETFIVFRFLFKGLSGIVLIITLITIPLSSIKTCLINILLGLQNYKRYNKLNIASQIFNVILLIMLLLISRSVFYALLANVLAMLAIIIYIINTLFISGYRIAFDQIFFYRMIRYGIKAQLSNLVQYITYSFDVFIINYFLGLTSAGYYFQAVSIANMMWQIPGAIATIMYPLVSSSEDKNYIYKVTNKTVRVSILFVFLVGFVLALLSRPIILALCGSNFEQSISALILLIPGISVFSISKILASSIAGMGRTDINLIISAIISTLTVALDLIIIPIYGINGASVVTSITYSLHAVVTIIFYKKLTQSHISDILFIKKLDFLDIKLAIFKKFN